MIASSGIFKRKTIIKEANLGKPKFTHPCSHKEIYLCPQRKFLNLNTVLSLLKAPVFVL